MDDIPDASAPGSPATLERLIRKRYPSARVSPQDPLATFGGSAPVWYVYRRDAPSPDDGVAAITVPADAPGRAAAAADRGAEDDGAAGSVGARADPGPGISHGSRPVYSVAATASMIGVPISILVGWDEADLVRPGPTPSGTRLYSRDDLEDLLQVKRVITAGKTIEEARAFIVDSRDRRAAGPFAAPGAGRRMLVLLAERDPYAAEMSEYFLRTEGYDVEVAFSAQEAEARALDRAPDVSVVELLIDGGAGPELCARLKSQGGTAVLAISTLDFEDAALRAGADAFLSKPLDPLQLISTIKDLLGESALLRARAE